jgi:hypothetical protein
MIKLTSDLKAKGWPHVNVRSVGNFKVLYSSGFWLPSYLILIGVVLKKPLWAPTILGGHWSYLLVDLGLFGLWAAVAIPIFGVVSYHRLAFGLKPNHQSLVKILVFCAHALAKRGQTIPSPKFWCALDLAWLAWA